MDRFARLHTSYLAAPEYPGCRGEGCRNDHLNADGYCADCAAELHVEQAEALDADAVLGIGAATELPLELAVLHTLQGRPRLATAGVKRAGRWR